MIFNKDKYLQVLIRVRAWTWCVGLNETHWPLKRYHDQNRQVVLKPLAFWVSLIRSKLPIIPLCHSLKGKYGSPIFNCLLEPVGCSLDVDNRPRSFSRRKRGYFSPSNSFLSFWFRPLARLTTPLGARVLRLHVRKRSLFARPFVVFTCVSIHGLSQLQNICSYSWAAKQRALPTKFAVENYHFFE